MKNLVLIFLVAQTYRAFASESAAFVPLFNGRDLTGWVNVNCAPETWTVRDGVIHCTGRPTGALRTVRQYENFILELEWRHLSSGGNSGVFIWGTPVAAPGVPFLRGIEVQVLDHGFNIPGKNEWYTTHGDVFPIHGATMKPFGRHHGERSFPSEARSKGSPEWNHYRVSCANGVLRLEVNGKEVSGGEQCHYRKGYLALESEGAPVEFRNLRLQELPASGATPEESAPEDSGFRTMFNGLDLRGWKTNTTTQACWRVGGERLLLRPVGSDSNGILWSEQVFGDAEFILDCSPSKNETDNKTFLPVIRLRGTEVKLTRAEPGKYQRFHIKVKGRDITIKCNDQQPLFLKLPTDVPSRAAFGLQATGVAVDFMNLYAKDL